jgi:serine protease Do
MDNENEFNFSNDNSFKKSKVKHTSNGFGKTVFVPFLSGIVGASLVVGTCVGVPSIKSKLIGQTHYTTSTSAQTGTDSTTNIIDLAQYSDTSVAVAAKVLPSVVGITVTYQVNSFFGSGSTQATGSGIIITEDGYIVTNNHVISSESSSSYYQLSEATSIKINLYNDSETYDATVIGTDSYTDLAVLKIEKTGLTPATLGNSDNLQVGEFVMAIGNPLGMDYSVTSGIVSAVNREVVSDGTTYNAIQTDAAINSGNSGGALVNSNGEVIGINTLKLSGTGIEGIGFAIPISSTTSIIDQLIEYQTVKRPYIGITGSAVDSTTAKRYNLPEGVYVESVEKDSPAEKAGIQQSDIITKIEGKEITSVTELNKVKYTYNIGDTITLTLVRNSQEMDVQVTLVETPESTETEDQNTSNSNQGQNNNSGSSIFNMFR